jgi:hypothetical protein
VHDAATGGRDGVGERVPLPVVGGIAVAGDLPGGVDGGACADRSAEGAEVVHDAVHSGRTGVEKGVVRGVARQVAAAGSLPSTCQSEPLIYFGRRDRFDFVSSLFNSVSPNNHFRTCSVTAIRRSSVIRCR